MTCENFSIISCFNLTQKIKNCFISLEAVVGDASLNLWKPMVKQTLTLFEKVETDTSNPIVTDLGSMFEI